ncbi:hypothetical protein R5W23_002517 [Gemmata sp. JC673]|uniref:RedB protein n=1 Tax=Gemmata algarum TaxID=2975278 RepID=A0ABU5F3C4_9BACT|nr:hypothetical protein [Gemmata algarum]MDY3561242.1 hypothetical protein [Gemmata algarum]
MTDSRTDPRGRFVSYRVVALVSWLTVLVGGIYLLAAHQFTPGPSGTVLHRWPEATAEARPRAVMFIHPHCPCTPASLRNFAALIAGNRCTAEIYVVANEPAGTPNGRAAAQVSGAACHADSDGRVAKRFGAMTSGHVFLYSPNGQLVFEGGITDGRGHEGENPGLRAATARVSGTESTLASFPVFGCTLQE